MGLDFGIERRRKGKNYENLELINSSNLDKKNITFRIPLNKEYTLKEDNIKNILNCIEKYSYFNVEIFKTHNLAESKCKSLNQEFISFSAVDDRELKEVLEKIQELNSLYNKMAIANNLDSGSYFKKDEDKPIFEDEVQ